MGRFTEQNRAENPLPSGDWILLPLLRTQTESSPATVAAAERFIQAVLAAETRLSGSCKKAILATVTQVRQNVSGFAFEREAQISPSPDDADAPVVEFTRKLSASPFAISKPDAKALQNAGFDEAAMIEAVVVNAWGEFLCTLARGLNPPARLELDDEIPSAPSNSDEALIWADPWGPFVAEMPHPLADLAGFQVLREQMGFVPNLFRIQASFPQAVEAEIALLDAILFSEEILGREQKETILLAVSAANLNTYGVALHSRVLGTLGMAEELCDQIVEDVGQATLLDSDKTLLLEVTKLAAFGPRDKDTRGCTFDADCLRTAGFREPQIVEAVTAAALANFLNTIQFGLAVNPDFPPRRIFTQKDLYPDQGDARLTLDAVSPPDPDDELVGRVQSGETDAFEELVRRHTRRILGTLAGMLGNTDDARDATQDVFLKAFEHVGQFEGRSKFSTWLTSIAIHTGTELLRQRKPGESLLDEEDGEENFRPRQVQSWQEDPEQLLAASQTSELVRQGILQLPQKYRVAVLLRDINQLSTEEAAAALGLSVPALKARVLRGRLMLRERLAPHFVRQEKVVPDA